MLAGVLNWLSSRRSCGQSWLARSFVDFEYGDVLSGLACGKHAEADNAAPMI